MELINEKTHRKDRVNETKDRLELVPNAEIPNGYATDKNERSDNIQRHHSLNEEENY